MKLGKPKGRKIYKRFNSNKNKFFKDQDMSYEVIGPFIKFYFRNRTYLETDFNEIGLDRVELL